MDNAHRVSELLSILPIVKYCQQLLLLGDHYQPAPQNSQSMFAISKGASMSLFEKLLSQGL